MFLKSFLRHRSFFRSVNLVFSLRKHPPRTRIWPLAPPQKKLLTPVQNCIHFFGTTSLKLASENAWWRERSETTTAKTTPTQLLRYLSEKWTQFETGPRQVLCCCTRMSTPARVRFFGRRFVCVRQLKSVRRQFNEYDDLKRTLFYITVALLSYAFVVVILLAGRHVTVRRVSIVCEYRLAHGPKEAPGVPSSYQFLFSDRVLVRSNSGFQFRRARRSSIGAFRRKYHWLAGLLT